MNSVGGNYQNIGRNTDYSQVNFVASPAMATKSASVFHHKTPEIKGASTSDIFGYGLIALLTGTVALKGNKNSLSKIKAFFQENPLIIKLKELITKHEIHEKIKNNSSNISSVYNAWKGKIMAKVKMSHHFNQFQKVNSVDN